MLCIQRQEVMKDYVLVVTVLCICVTGILSQNMLSQAECGKELMKCFEPIVNFSKSIRGGDFVPYMTVEDFQTFCVKYDGVDECFSKLKCEGSQTLLELFEGNIDAMEFMCKEEPDKYPGFAACLSHPVVHTEMRQCHEGIGDLQDPKEMCGPLNEYLDCGYKLLEDKCTKDEASWLEEILVKSVQPLNKTYKCKLKRPSHGSSNRGAVAAGVIITLIVVALIVGVLIIYYRRRRQHGAKGYRPTNKSGIYLDTVSTNI